MKRISDFGGVLSYTFQKKGNEDIIKLLLKSGAECGEQNLTENEPPLFCVCRDGELEQSAILLKAGADINAKNDRGMPPLWDVCAINSADFAASAPKDVPRWCGFLLSMGRRFLCRTNIQVC